QAKRIAGIIHGDERLKSRMTAGLFIGDDKSGASFPVMQEHMVISNHPAQQESPPDILLTNYKMLDYLLLRKKYFSLFSHNAPETLRFLVVDEIHTFDGAQGSDLACLFRRIKYRLGTPENHLCCVGTSATTGESGDKLIRYAESIFGESFDVDSIVGEDRLSPEEFLDRAGTSESTGSFPPLSAFRDLPFDGTTHADEYIRKSLSRWFPDADLSDSEAEGNAALGRALYASPAFQRLIRSFGAGLFTFEEAVRDYRDYLGLDDLQLPKIRNLLASLFSLISVARDEGESGGMKPFIQVRIQLWARELRRMVAPIERSPQLMFSDDRTVEEAADRKALPLVHCRDCGTTGWVSYRSGTDTSRHFKDGLPEIYSHYFMASKNTWFLYPVDDVTQESQLELGEPGRLCASCLYHLGMDDEDCPSCGEADDEKLVPIRAENPTKVSKKTSHIYGSHDCPWCSSYNSLTIIGSQAASINAVALSQLFASPYNDDKKAIAFSDSVQDA
ncbi:MAG: hypothetical protein KAJ98_10960, partial [Spirochaetaceae bacterium]|nr:hypothetical protein [Spirochaetaceae bacterium]